MPALLFATLLAATFKEHVIATDLKGGYQVVAADLNHDGKPDLIALGTQMSELVWYENPTWERHVIASGLTGMINLAVADDQIVLAYGFSMVYANSKGIVAVLKPNGDPRQPWTLTEIDRLPTSHRLRLANIDGKKVVINAPLIGPNAVAPEYRDHVPLVYYKPGEWKRTVISADNEGVQHGITVVDWDGKGRDSILTASFSGIDLYRFLKTSGSVLKSRRREKRNQRHRRRPHRQAALSGHHRALARQQSRRLHRTSRPMAARRNRRLPSSTPTPSSPPTSTRTAATKS